MKVTTSIKVALGITTGVVLATISATSANAATQSANSTINATIGETISLAVSGDVTISATPGAGVKTGSHNVTVSTNNTAGYKLNLASSTADTTLAKSTDTLAASTASFATPATLGNDQWGYRLDSFTANKFAGIKATGSAETIKTTSAPATSEVTPVTWGVNVVSAKPSGTYSRQVTYTAVTN